MKYKAIIIAGICACTALVAGAVAYGDESAPKTAAPREPFTSSLRVNGLSGGGAGAPTGAETASLADHLALLGKSDPKKKASTAEIQSEVEGARLLSDANGVRITAVYLDRTGELCYSATSGVAKGGAVTCSDKFDPTGLIWSANIWNNTSTISGIAEDGVTSVEVLFADGDKDAAVLDNNAFSWKGDRALSGIRVHHGDAVDDHKIEGV